MTWIKLDDGFADHPKLLKAGPLGLAVHVRALCYCARHLTDGFIPRNAVTLLLRDVSNAKIPRILVSCGLWIKQRNGYQIKDYLDYNPSREQVLAARKHNANRQLRHRKRNACVTPVSRKRNAVSNGHVTTPPTPTPIKHITSPLKPPKGARPCEDCKTVLQELNQLTGRHYRGDGTGLSNLHARHSTYSLEDCLKVVRVKAAQWLQDPEMSKYLRPSTLFRKTKFDGYVNEPMKIHDKDLFVGKHSEGEEWGTVTFPGDTQN